MRDTVPSPRKGEEFIPPEAEFTPPLAEFTPLGQGQEETGKKRRRPRLLLAAAAFLLLFVLIPRFSPAPPPAVTAPPVPTEDIPTAAPVPEQTPEPTPEPTPDSGVPEPELIFFCFSSEYHGLLRFTHPELVTGAYLVLWDLTTDSQATAYDLSPKDLYDGSFELVYDDWDLYLQHMDFYMQNDLMPELELRCTLRYDAGEGEEEITLTAAATHELGWGFHYDAPDLEPDEYTHPGCFVMKSYESYNRPVKIVLNHPEQLAPDVLCITLTVNGQVVDVPDAEFILLEDPVYRLDENGDYVPTENTYYYAILILPKPDGIPSSGVAHVTVTQLFEDGETVWTTEKDIPYT